MNKQRLIELVSEKTSMKKNKVKVVVESVLETIVEAVSERGEKVVLSDFGTFKRAQRAPKRGKLPNGGKEIQIPPKKVPDWKAGKAFKEKTNK